MCNNTLISVQKNFHCTKSNTLRWLVKQHVLLSQQAVNNFCLLLLLEYLINVEVNFFQKTIFQPLRMLRTQSVKPVQTGLTRAGAKRQTFFVDLHLSKQKECEFMCMYVAICPYVANNLIHINNL